MHQQGSIMWHKQRLGKITGSNINKLMTGKPGILSTGALTYCEELACDIVYGEPEEDTFSSRDMERGLELEPCAVESFLEYMEEIDPLNPLTVDEVGFILHPEYPMYGASVDGIVSDSGNLEIKCRKRRGHLNQFKIINAIKKGEKITAKESLAVAICQQQWGMFCTGASHSYFVGYTDELDIGEGHLLVHCFDRDQDMIDAMKAKADLAVPIIAAKVKDYRELIKHIKEI